MEKLLLGIEALEFLEKGGLAVLKAELARDPDEAASAAATIGFPVALKISSPNIIHKTEEAGVKLFLKSEDEVRKAFQDIVDRFAARTSKGRLDGVLVQRMASGVELIVGSLEDEQFGPVLMFGLGGILAEAMKDVSFRLIPLGRYDARDMIADLRHSSVLKKPRGETIDVHAIENFLLQVSALILKHREIHEMDLNPVFASQRGLEICDARIKVREA